MPDDYGYGDPGMEYPLGYFTLPQEIPDPTETQFGTVNYPAPTAMYDPNDPYGLGASRADNPLYQGGPASIYEPGTGVGGSSSSWGNALNALLKSLGITSKDGSLNLASLLPMLTALGSGLYTQSQTKKATEQTVNAINSANDQIKSLLGGAQSLYDPYVQAGTSAIDRMSTQAPSNLAANYGPLASKYKPLASQGAVTLTRFARGK